MNRESTLHPVPTGNIQSYPFLFGLGVTVIIYYVGGEVTRDQRYAKAPQVT